MREKSTAGLRILYVAPLNPFARSAHRIACIRALGHEVVGMDSELYLSSGGRILSGIRIRTLIGLQVNRLNRNLLDLAAKFRPNIIWLEKALLVRRKTVAKLRKEGIFTIHQNDDNPFGPRKDPGWRLFLDALPEYDLHLVPRETSLEDYRKAGAKDVFMVMPAYEPTLHFPPTSVWTDANRTIDVSFCGFPHDHRPQFIFELWKRYGIVTKVWGDWRWKRHLSEDAIKALLQGSMLPYDDYRETIWKSRINLGFVSHLNNDEYTARTFEIPACRGFLLAEDTPGHRKLLHDGEEAVFFRSVEDCAEKIHKYLGDEVSRSRIAAAGYKRIVASGASNLGRVSPVFKHISLTHPQIYRP